MVINYGVFIFKNPRHALVILCWCVMTLNFSSTFAQSNPNSQIEFSHFNNATHYTTENGLSSDYVSDIKEDKSGFLWLATGKGVTRFDGNYFTNFQYYYEFGILKSIGYIHTIFIDESGNKIWITGSNGLFYSSINTIYFQKIKTIKPSVNFSTGKLNGFLLDQQNKMWLLDSKNGLISFDATNNHSENFNFENKLESENHKLNHLTCIAKDPINQNILWIGTLNGLIRFNSISKKYQVLTYKNPEDDQNQIRKIHVTDKDVYLGTWSEGVIVFDKQLKQFNQPLKANFPNSHNLVLNFYAKEGQDLWITTDGGLIQYDVVAKVLKKVISHDLEKGILRGISFIDSRGIIWFGDSKGLFKYNPDYAEYKFIELEQRNKLQAPMQIREIIMSNGFFYVAGQNSSGIYKINANDYSVEVITIPLLKHSKTSGYQIKDIIKMNRDELLILSDKIIIFNTKTQESRFSPLQINHPGPSLQAVIKDKNNNYWVGSREAGLSCINFENNSIINYKEEFDAFDEGNYRWINSLYLDSLNKLWIAKGSKSVMNLQDSTIVSLAKNDPVKSFKDVGNFQEDSKGRIWMAGYNEGLGFTTFKDFKKGITQIAEGRFKGIYSYNDSLKWTVGKHLGVLNTNTLSHREIVLNKTNGNLILRGPIINDNKNNLIIGCENGIVVYNHQERIKRQETQDPYILTISRNEELLYDGIDLNANNWKFESNTTHLTLNISVLEFYQPMQTSYSYMIQDEWIELDNNNQIILTNLTSANYSLKLKACNGLNNCNEIPVEYNFEIRAPWYGTWLAYLIYSILLISILYWFYRFQLSKKLAISEHVKLKELNALKSNLYTNITHEFRTPLTVILGLADTIKDDFKVQNYKAANEAMIIIERNGKDLLLLVNQLLGLSKAESGTMELNLIQADVVPFLRYICESFQSLAKTKHIDITSYFETESLIMDFDDGKLQIIISNLLSNAIKFSSSAEKIIFHVKSETIDEVESVIIKVKDYGIGISEKAISHIFDRFYQVENLLSKGGKGTGIGLALTKELVSLMNGTISVKSEERKGTEFTVTIPITRNSNTSTKAITSPIDFIEDENIKQEWSLQLVDSDVNLPEALIIEDNKDVAYYLRLCLQNKYHCIFANNGNLGLEKAFDKIPDIIICDVMMPERDGLEVCKLLKTDERTDHIPVILLTAKTSEKDRLKGLQHGADAYLTKPFLKAELLTRLDQLIILRKRITQSFAKNKFSQILTSKDHTPETKFLQKVIQIIQNNMDDPNLGSRHVAQKMHLSESQIYRKLKAITGKSTAVFIRSVRLEKARDLIQTTEKSISEIAYEVGFNDPSWFSRAFKEEFGQSPSAIHK